MILMKNIIKEGNPNLKKVCAKVPTPVSEEDRQTLIDMLGYLINSQDEDKAAKYGLRPGVGLAAPQINILKRMIAILANDEFGKLHLYLLVNPEIVKHSKNTIYLAGGEGCLSVVRVTKGVTPRYESVTVKTLNYNINKGEFEDIVLELKGYMSIVFQHEFDHLNGTLFTDKLFDELPDSTPLGEKEEED